MGTRDTQQRPNAVPFFGQVMGYNHSEVSDQDVSNTYASVTAPPSITGIGDLINLSAFVGTGSQPSYTAGKKDFMIRILRPSYAQILNAYLNISITFDTTETSPAFSISCGYAYDTDGISALTPPQSFVDSCMTAITGGTARFTGVAGQPLTRYKINLTQLIPQYGKTNFSNDSFIIGVHFAKSPVQTGSYHLNKFFVNGSALVLP